MQKKTSAHKKKWTNKVIIRCFNVHVYFEYYFKYAILTVFLLPFFFKLTPL